MSTACSMVSEMINFLLMLPKYLKKDDLQPWDILLFPIENSTVQQNTFKHKAICSGGGEDIPRPAASGDPSSPAPSRPQRKFKCSASSTRTCQAIRFLLVWDPYFTEVSGNDVQPGDILLFPIEDSSLSLKICKHAVTYCGDGEVIHFQKVDGIAKIIKEGYEAMKRERQKCQILRKKGGINHSEFQRKVREAMNWKTKYSLLTNNCIHFALHLVGLADFYIEMTKCVRRDGVTPRTTL